MTKSIRPSGGWSFGRDGVSWRSGVGLTVVDSVLAAHGGDLAWHREVAGVVTVTVRLPVAPLPVPAV